MGVPRLQDQTTHKRVASPQAATDEVPLQVPQSIGLKDWPNIHAPDARILTAGATTGTPRALRTFLRSPTALAGSAILAAIIVAAIFAPMLYPGDPLSMVARPLLWPGQNSSFPLGTDSLGRDIAAGLLHGARISLLVGAAATMIGLTLGILIGATAGYSGGRIDDTLVRLIELFQTIPSFVLLVVLVAIAQPSVITVIWAIGLIT